MPKHQWQVLEALLERIPKALYKKPMETLQDLRLSQELAFLAIEIVLWN